MSIVSRCGYRPYFEKRELNVIQPDFGLVGGIAEGKKICSYAYVCDATVQAHVCDSLIATVSSPHVRAAVPDFFIHEHHTNALKPWNAEMCSPDLQSRDGYSSVPDRPELGTEPNDDVIKR